ncbi:hypothetical protein [Pseudalkalibacillus berkeleyi]|uniref:DUF3906 family protein n=1 Tax=Pseudalkalibacillus berkeleyi TaxID=1069813 RepID=A0ABS9GU53_9BACL|nr:hypothetical protein [Pseudalkalibacillus berkeleyi]MCF6136369.1 hypothetical protein [Pseudalkalibacillus berkeleyi]
MDNIHSERRVMDLSLTAKITIDFLVEGSKEYYVELLDIPEEVSAGELQVLVEKRVGKVKEMKCAEILNSSIKIDHINQVRH